MATLAETNVETRETRDALVGTSRAHPVDRWIFVAMAAWYIIVVLVGFIPDSLMKIEMVKAGLRPPFPAMLHAHAVVMGSFMLLLLAQTWLMATGRPANHMRLGMVGFALAALLVVIGFLLVPTIYHEVRTGAEMAPPPARAQMEQILFFVEDIVLLQIRAGVLFAIFIGIAFAARKTEPGLHKRMMFLAVLAAIPAATDRMTFLPTSFPESPLVADLYPLVVIAPLLTWDLVRNRYVHKAYWIWAALTLPAAALVHMAWGSDWWHQAVKQMMGVG